MIVEDEPDILQVLQYNLRREGFETMAVSDGSVGLALIEKNLPALVLLDLMLPGMGGLEICRRLKSDPRTRNIRVIMVTAKGEESDIVLGLGIGADDYITKPFSPKELVARVQAVLRRSHANANAGTEEPVVFEELLIDPNRHKVTCSGTTIELTATEFRLLHYLINHPGRVFTRAQLLNRVLGDNIAVVDRNIDVHIRAIRKKVGGNFIETIRGIGYRFKDKSQV